MGTGEYSIKPEFRKPNDSAVGEALMKHLRLEEGQGAPTLTQIRDRLPHANGHEEHGGGGEHEHGGGGEHDEHGGGDDLGDLANSPVGGYDGHGGGGSLGRCSFARL